MITKRKLRLFAAWDHSERDRVEGRAALALLRRPIRRTFVRLARRLGWHALALRLTTRMHRCATCRVEFLLDRWNLPPVGAEGLMSPACSRCRPSWVTAAMERNSAERDVR